MTVPSSGFTAHVSIERVASIKELADIAADIVRQDELAAWVVRGEITDVEDTLIKDDEVFTVFNFGVE